MLAGTQSPAATRARHQQPCQQAHRADQLVGLLERSSARTDTTPEQTVEGPATFEVEDQCKDPALPVSEQSSVDPAAGTGAADFAFPADSLGALPRSHMQFATQPYSGPAADDLLKAFQQATHDPCPQYAQAARHGRPKLPRPTEPADCPRCGSGDTKFCYYNNYNIKQPRYYCKVRVCCQVGLGACKPGLSTMACYGGDPVSWNHLPAVQLHSRHTAYLHRA